MEEVALTKQHVQWNAQKSYKASRLSVDPLIPIGFKYIMQFNLVRGKGDYSLDGEKLGIAHKHTIKTVQNAHGDIFDCVDIHKQPAFDHPLLKDHSIQMEPSSFPAGNSEEVISSTLSSQISFMKEVCSIGTIPILRPKNIEDSFSKNISSTSNALQDIDVKPLTSFEAQLRMKSDSYYGAEADLNVYGLPQVSSYQLSSSIIWILNDGDGTGPIEQVNSIMAGWMVNPSLFGDNNTHLFINWTVDGYQRTGCYNTQCPGFVQVSREIPLGATLSPLSVYNGDQYAMRILIYKDARTGNWWLVFGKDKRAVGYWPKSLFNTLNDHATKVYWGGLVWCPIDNRSPPMGSSHFPEEGLSRACFSAQLKLVDESNRYK